MKNLVVEKSIISACSVHPETKTKMDAIDKVASPYQATAQAGTATGGKVGSLQNASHDQGFVSN